PSRRRASRPASRGASRAPRRGRRDRPDTTHARQVMAQPKVNADLPIQALLQEKRKFPPPKALVKSAVMSKKAIYAEAARNPVKFWEQRARELTWFKPWKKALEWKPPYSKWFIGRT